LKQISLKISQKIARKLHKNRPRIAKKLHKNGPKMQRQAKDQQNRPIFPIEWHHFRLKNVFISSRAARQTVCGQRLSAADQWALSVIRGRSLQAKAP